MSSPPPTLPEHYPRMPWPLLAAGCFGVFAASCSGTTRAPFLIDMARDGEADAMVLCRTPRPYRLGSAEVLPWQAGLKQIFGL